MTTRLTDDLSGVQQWLVQFNSPSSTQFVQVFGTTGLIAGTTSNGTFQGTSQVPQFAEAGIFSLASFSRIKNFMIPTFQAVQLHRFMGSGRTTPALCGCEDENGKLVGEFVVKLRGGLDRNVTGLAAELVATQLATYFGIPVPAPALVSIDAEFADLVALSFPEKSDPRQYWIEFWLSSTERRDYMAGG